jgi:hypothetical protein
MFRPQYGLPPRELPDALSITRGPADSGGETGPLCQDDGKKRTVRGRKLGTLAQTIAVLTSATDQLIGDTPVSEICVSYQRLIRHKFPTCNVYRAEPIKPGKTEYTSNEGTRIESACPRIER